MRYKCEKHVAGVINFGDKIDITDPCYNRDVWCRMNDVKIIPGKYTCIAWIRDTGDWGRRVATVGIYLNGVIPKSREMHEIGGGIGVDAGLAGFFENKKDFTDEEWCEFCNLIHDDYPTVLADENSLFKGIVTSSGYGDGGYGVFAARDPDHYSICALEIRFIERV